MKQWIFWTVLMALWSQALAGFAAPASRRANVDSQGVMRWLDDGSEVALFGVNYYTPFWHNYPDLKRIRADHRKVIDQDLAHFARMGLDVLRLHVFDREVSDREGNLVENEHLALLDYLIAKAKERGIYTVLTPIAWWDTPVENPGFSSRFTMPQMITDPAARSAQTNYLAQFVRHVNRHTGLSYRDDPAVLCFELINEPQYAPNTTDAQVLDYVNALADAVRSAGCEQPIFYNGWGNRHGVIRDARVQGSTFGWYPTGLASGRSLRRNFLPVVNQYGGSDYWNPSMRTEVLARKAKIIYEFDAADVPGSYMYPAMARSFRSGGAQIAAQFQYDPLPLSPFNQGWQTHYLNLVCTPQKAVSFIIAAEAFRRLPRLQDYGAYPASSRFGPFRVSYEEDLSEMATESEFFYSNSTRTEPPAPGKLRRIVGCGSSKIVRYEGAGAYFLDRLAGGAWRLEVYPDAVWVNEPYGEHRLDREVSRIIWREWPMEMRLPDLGSEFSVQPLDAGNTWKTAAAEGAFRIRPGVYLLQRPGATGDGWKNAKLPVHIGMAEFFALPESKHAPAVVRHEPGQVWVEGKALPLEFTVATSTEPEGVFLEWNGGAGETARRMELKREASYRYVATVPAQWLTAGAASYRIGVRAGGKVERFPAGAASNTVWRIPVYSRSAPVPLFEAERNPAYPQAQLAWRKSLVTGMTEGRKAVRIDVEKFGPPPSSISFRVESTDVLEPWRELLGGRTNLSVRARGAEATTRAVEVVVLERDGSAWGTNIPLSTEWREVQLPLSSLRHFPHWGGGPAHRGGAGDRIRPQEIAGVSVCFGAWLYPDHAAEPHSVEIERIDVK